jgi:pyruvate,water dikinase
MRRMEVKPEGLKSAEVVLQGNGASRGAGQGTVRFLRSALELNKVNKGDILAAERTDPDMVPGMRIASGIMADAGGDTSHAAITSRELGIPAVIGIKRLEILRTLDGQEVTVDGSRGCIYRGLIPMEEVGGIIDVAELPATKTKIGLILADVGQSLFLSRLRNVPDFEVGLLRAEFMLGNIGVHPMALEAYDKGTLESIVRHKLSEIDEDLTKVIKEQLDAGVVSIDFKLRKYVGLVTGLAQEMEELSNASGLKGTDEVLAIHRQIRELDKKMDDHLEMATQRLDILKTSKNLNEHVKAIMGFLDANDLGFSDPDEERRSREVNELVAAIVQRIENDPYVVDLMARIKALREDVARKVGLQRAMNMLETLPERIKQILVSRGYRSGKELYVQTLSQGLGLFAMAFYGKSIIYRTTDYKTNEYRNLLGGVLFEFQEDNPMLGYRGVSRNVHDWELEAFKLARGAFGGRNLHIMLPFVRTIEEARSLRDYLAQVHNLRSGEDDLKVIQMSEIPSNAILAKEFIKEFDGFSIGSNDMTQLVLGTDRDNSRLQHIYDEEDPGVVWAILTTIFTGQKYGKKVGFCGQGVSNSMIIRGLVCVAGIVSASVVPDTYAQTKFDVAAIEKENISVADLGGWIKKQHLDRVRTLLQKEGYGHILKKYVTAEDLTEWFDGENARLMHQLRDNLGSTQEEFYRQELDSFRALFHKPVIYAAWDWNQTVEDALHQGGFATFEEQQKAMEEQRKHVW